MCSVTAPELRQDTDSVALGGGISLSGIGVELPTMGIADYVAFAAQRIAEAVGVAWCARQSGAIGYGLGQAVVGHNRRSSYYSGRSQMYGDTSTADFSHMEGYEDHSVNVLATWDTAGWATGSSYCRSAPPPATSRRMSRWAKQPKSVCCVWQGGRNDRKSRSE